MFTKKTHDVSFYGVAMALIVVGAAIFVCGLVAWYIQSVGVSAVVALPFFKVIGGLIILALGYVVLELEMLRKK